MSSLVCISTRSRQKTNAPLPVFVHLQGPRPQTLNPSFWQGRQAAGDDDDDDDDDEDDFARSAAVPSKKAAPAKKAPAGRGAAASKGGAKAVGKGKRKEPEDAPSQVGGV
jgi:hypothetical protein